MVYRVNSGMCDSKNAVQAIQTILERTQQNTLQAWRGHERELLIELVRTLDFTAFAFTLAPNSQVLVTEDAERHYMLLGAATAMQPLLSILHDDPGCVPWEPAKPALVEFANEYLIQCGKLAHLRRVLELERFGLAKASLVQRGHLIVRVTPDTQEAEDRDSQAEIDTYLSHSDETSILDEADLSSRIDAYTDVHDGWFIRYDPDHEAFAHHREIAAHRARSFAEAQALPPSTIIGGRSFQAWTGLSTSAQGRALHHIACATRLRATHDNLDLRNLLTIFARKDDVVAVLQESGERSGNARLAMSLMTLDAETATWYEQQHEIPLPYYIDFGRDFVLLPCFAGLLNPYAGLTWKLRSVYRSDWDKGVDGREEIFRTDLRIAFPAPRFLVSQTGFALRRPNGELITDIDAVIVDREVGSLALVQLKWHDIFGRSLRERSSRMRNLLAANIWVERVTEWAAGRSAADIGAALNLGTIAGNNEPLLFVLTRHTARFTGATTYDPRAPWLGWAQLLPAAQRTGDPDLLRTIFRHFQGRTETPEPPQEASSVEFHLPDLFVEVIVE
jgi:hypothetical protein